MKALTYKQQARVLYLVLITLGLIAIGLLGCSQEEIPDPVENSSNGIVSRAMLCYNKSDRNQSYCMRNLTTELGSAIECTYEYDFLHGWEHLAGVEVGNKQFVFYHVEGLGSTKWMISEVLPTGRMGSITDGGDRDYYHWGNNYETLIGYRVGDRGFIFGQDSHGDHPWFVQEINSQGKLAAGETASGTWHYYYESVTPMYINGNTWLFFQTDKEDHRWFIASVGLDGKIYPSYEGSWGYFWNPVTSVTVGDQTYLIGIRKSESAQLSSESEWFIQRINSDGSMGEETDRGFWTNYYHILVSFTYGGKSCIFGHNDGYGGTDGNWFIQEITADGKMGTELSHGGIDMTDTFFYPFTMRDPTNFRYVIEWNFMDVADGQTGTRSPVYWQPWTAPARLGGGAALANINRDTKASPDALLMGIQDLSVGGGRFYYQISWDLDYKVRTAPWSKTYFGPYCGKTQAGGGADIADMDGNGIPDLLLMSVDDPEGANTFCYYIGWNLDAGGNVASWSNKFEVDGLGWDNSGGGMDISDLDLNNRAELVLAAIDNPAGPNKFWYRIGRNLDKSGNAESWTPCIIAPFNLGDQSAGGGAAVADLNKNNKPDLVLMAIDAAQGPNTFYFYVGWDIDIDGNAVSWSSFTRPALGNMTSGGGIAIGNIDKDGIYDMLLMTVDDPYGKE